MEYQNSNKDHLKNIGNEVIANKKGKCRVNLYKPVYYGTISFQSIKKSESRHIKHFGIISKYIMRKQSTKTF